MATSKCIFKKFYEALNIVESEKIIDTLSSFGDDKATGTRSSASPASNESAFYLYSKFNNCGLQNVTIDRYSCDKWVYKGAHLIYKDINGVEQKIILGGYQCNIEALEEEITLVDAKDGFLEDYKALGDITGKYVLFDYCHWSKGFYYNLPNTRAFQGYKLGAKGAIIAYICDDETWNDSCLMNRIANPNPEYIPMLAISKGDIKILRELIALSPTKELKVKLTAHDYVEPFATGYNVYGEIKGRTDEVIYLMAHYDGYYHSYFDDAFGVSCILGISKAIIESGYIPNKTIRVIAHGSEEWGRQNCDFYWAIGAYRAINDLHPEWAKKAFAVISIDSNYPILGQNDYTIRTSNELYNYTKESIKPIIDSFNRVNNSNVNFKVIRPNYCATEDFAYLLKGIPCISPSENNDGLYIKYAYHSSYDRKEFGFDRKVYKLVQSIYGKLLLDLDSEAVRPMDFYQRFIDMKASLDTSIVSDELIKTVDEIIPYSFELSKRIKGLNNPCSVQKYQYLNIQLYELYKLMQDSFISLNWLYITTFPHENYQGNIKLLVKAIDALKVGNPSIEYVIENYLSLIDYNCNAYLCDKQTYDYFANRMVYGNQDSWGYGLITKPNEDLYKVLQLLKEKSHRIDPSLTKEILMLEQALANQRRYLKEVSKKEIYDLNKVIEKISYITKMKCY